MNNITYPLAGKTPASPLPFSPVVRVGNLLFVSGQASVDASGKIVSDTFEGEFNRSIFNLSAILQSAGSSLRQIVQTRCYVDCADDLGEYNILYRAAFQEPYPARTTITNCFGGVLKFEIDCIAVASDESAS